MKESDFHKEWRESWLYYYPDCHIVKVPDSIRSAESRFIPPKPYDFYLFYKSQYIAMELKLKNINRAISFNEVTEWQEENLKLVELNGGIGLIVINFRGEIEEPKKKSSTPKIGFSPGRHNIVMCIPAWTWRNICKMTDKKSIRCSELYEFIVPRSGPETLSETLSGLVMEKPAAYEDPWPVSDVILSLRRFV